MIQVLFNINIVLASACFGIGLIMLIGVVMDAVSNAKSKQS